MSDDFLKPEVKPEDILRCSPEDGSGFFLDGLLEGSPISLSGTVGPTGLFPSSMPIGSSHPTLAESLMPSLLQRWTEEAKVRDLEIEIGQLKKKYSEALESKRIAQSEIDAEKKKGAAYDGAVKAKEEVEKNLIKLQTDLAKKQSFNHIVHKVEEKARDLLFENESFVKLFNCEEPRSAFVVSVDLRKSTTLMLKAREPQRFAMFIKDLCDKLYSAILESHGVFDKFTGDGILAFFPEFYSGKDAGYFAIKAAALCHKIFTEEYRKHRNCFSSVLTEVGLGIGIDYGFVNLVSLWGGLTVVGAPVVYACRMGGAPAGRTLLNQPAFEVALDRYSAFCSFREAEIEVKGEGKTMAYEVELSAKEYQATAPDWLALIKEFSK